MNATTPTDRPDADPQGENTAYRSVGNGVETTFSEHGAEFNFRAVRLLLDGQEIGARAYRPSTEVFEFLDGPIQKLADTPSVDTVEVLLTPVSYALDVFIVIRKREALSGPDGSEHADKQPEIAHILEHLDKETVPEGVAREIVEITLDPWWDGPPGRVSRLATPGKQRVSNQHSNPARPPIANQLVELGKSEAPFAIQYLLTSNETGYQSTFRQVVFDKRFTGTTTDHFVQISKGGFGLDPAHEFDRIGMISNHQKSHARFLRIDDYEPGDLRPEYDLRKTKQITNNHARYAQYTDQTAERVKRLVRGELEFDPFIRGSTRYDDLYNK